MAFRYETHLHTAPVSACGVATVEETLTYYKQLGYDGIVLTNHFLDGNIRIDQSVPYEEKIKFYFSDFERAQQLAPQIGIKVFCGVEMSHFGTDFLVYGLDKEWYLAHPEIMDMKRNEQLDFLRQNGAYVVQAHPFREAFYINCFRLFPRNVDAVESVNANNTDQQNEMAHLYAQHYGLKEIYGSDNHKASAQRHLAGVELDHPVASIEEFVTVLRSGQYNVFVFDVDGE